VLACALVLASACAGEDADTDEMATPEPAAMDHAAPAAELTAEEQQAVAGVRQIADQYRDFAAAKTAGYTKQYPEGCVQTADGSQGFHFMNEALVDDKIDINTPELVMFEPKADGTMELIGVDYVIPFDRWTSAEPPQVLGRPMMRNEPLGVWALHIWTHRDNPSGMFAAFNPAANCDHATAAKM
jgi:hypothetical protein